MTTLTLELSTEQYEQLQTEATQAGEPVQRYAHRLLTEGMSPARQTRSEREQVVAALRKAGILGELGPAMKKRASEATMTLAEVQAALDASDGPPLRPLPRNKSANLPGSCQLPGRCDTTPWADFKSYFGLSEVILAMRGPTG